MEWLSQTLISNLLIASLLAVGAFICGKIPKLESLAYGLWILFFIKLVTPSWINVGYVYSGKYSESVIQSNRQISHNPTTTSQQLPDSPEYALPSYISSSEQATSFANADTHPDHSLPHGLVLPRIPGEIRNPENLLITAWAVGAVFMSWVAFRRIRNFRRLVGMADPTGNEDIQSRMNRLAAQCGLSRIPKILIYSICLSPGIAWTPGGYKIFIPSGFWTTLNDDEKDLAILHEIGHLKRGDCLRRILEIPMMITFWWFPLTWLASRELRRLEELLCDRWVQEHASLAPEIYAGLLVDFLEYFSGDREGPMPELLCSLACRGLNNHKNRISLILENRRPAFLTRWVVCTCLGLAGIISIPVSLRRQNDPPSSPPASIPLNDNEDHQEIWEPVKLPIHQFPTLITLPDPSPAPSPAPEKAVTTGDPGPLNDFLVDLNKELAALSFSFPQLKGISLSADSHVNRIRNDEAKFPGGSRHPVSYQVHYVSSGNGLVESRFKTSPFRFIINIFRNQEGLVDFSAYLAGQNSSELQKPFLEILDAAVNNLNSGNLDQLFP